MQFGILWLLCGPLGITVKSHKPPGAVSVRTIHRGIKPCWSGLSRWVVGILTPILSQLPWLVPDTQGARQLIKSARVKASDVLAAIDLKDFFLSGTATEVTDGVGSLVPLGIRSVFKHALFFLLDNQYVLTTLHSYLYKCISGSGIGLLHSAHVSNALFFARVESRMDLALTCKLYVRYHDDILALCSSYSAVGHIVQTMRRFSAGIFTLKVTSLCSLGCTPKYLDLDVTVCAPTLRVQCNTK
jgi:hypothetical protein